MDFGIMQTRIKDLVKAQLEKEGSSLGGESRDGKSRD